MAERSLRVILRAEVQQYKRDLAEAENATKQFADNVTNYIAEHRADIDALANKVGVLGLAMVSAAGAAIMKFADFDAAVSAVAATGDDAAGSIDALRVAAIDAGQETVFSATEAAGAIENLAKLVCRRLTSSLVALTVRSTLPLPAGSTWRRRPRSPLWP